MLFTTKSEIDVQLYNFYLLHFNIVTEKMCLQINLKN
jgi:hypothetical protein